MRVGMAVLMSVSSVVAQTCAEALPARVAAEVKAIQSQHGVTGMAVGVSLGGKRQVFAYGVSRANSIFELGSVSKLFTSTLVGYAVAEGKLSLDGAVSQYLPEMAGSALDRVNVAQLATYTPGGMPLQVPDAVKTNEDMVAFFRGWKPEYAPGTMRTYSNPSIGLAGRVAARRLGKPFAELMEKTLFPKLGLSETYITVPERRTADYDFGYAADGRRVKVTPGMFDQESYGVKTTAGDLLQFVERSMRPETVADKKLRQGIGLAQRGYYRVGGMTQGLGWEIYPWPIALEGLLEGTSPKLIFEANRAEAMRPPKEWAGGVLLNKTGSTNGFGTYVVMVPEKRMGVVMLANKNYPNASRVKAGYAILKAMEACKP
jgi:beta-lactamase class C